VHATGKLYQPVSVSVYVRTAVCLRVGAVVYEHVHGD